MIWFVLICFMGSWNFVELICFSSFFLLLFICNCRDLLFRFVFLMLCFMFGLVKVYNFWSSLLLCLVECSFFFYQILTKKNVFDLIEWVNRQNGCCDGMVCNVYVIQSKHLSEIYRCDRFVIFILHLFLISLVKTFNLIMIVFGN